MEQSAIHSLDEQTHFSLPIVAIIFVVVILAGIGVGFVSATVTMPKSQNGNISNANKPQAVSNGKTSGVVDKTTFKDQAEGTLREGGLDGEGNFHLERPGGESQYVYLTSTTVDLSQYVGKKVRVWGQTFSGQKAGWLMDVGLVELI